MFLSQEQIFNVVALLSNSNMKTSEKDILNPLVHFKRLYLLRNLILRIVGRDRLPLLEGDSLIEFEDHFKHSSFFENLMANIEPYCE